MVETMRMKKVIAESTSEANEQHYEIPSEFFVSSLEKDDFEIDSLDEAEERALRLVLERANLKDGQEILELGCGWGSLTLFMAENFPTAKITAVSNSHSQRAFINARAADRKLNNINVITCDMNVFEPPNKARFDRIVSCEMFEHMRGYDKLFQRVSSWLSEDALLFIHVFCHRSHAYFFDEAEQHSDADNWMAKYFFSGGVMPSERLYEAFASEAGLTLDQRWRVDGRHYSKTSYDWLKKLDENREVLLSTSLKEAYGAQAALWFNRWRIFYLSCAELFAFNGGKEWFVSHSTWRKAK